MMTMSKQNCNKKECFQILSLIMWVRLIYFTHLLCLSRRAVQMHCLWILPPSSMTNCVFVKASSKKWSEADPYAGAHCCAPAWCWCVPSASSSSTSDTHPHHPCLDHSVHFFIISKSITRVLTSFYYYTNLSCWGTELYCLHYKNSTWVSTAPTIGFNFHQHWMCNFFNWQALYRCLWWICEYPRSFIYSGGFGSTQFKGCL